MFGEPTWGEPAAEYQRHPGASHLIGPGPFYQQLGNLVAAPGSLSSQFSARLSPEKSPEAGVAFLK